MFKVSTQESVRKKRSQSRPATQIAASFSRSGESLSEKIKVLVIGPMSSTGGMASVMRWQFSKTPEHLELMAFDNSKQTPPDRSWRQGLGSQVRLAYRLYRALSEHRPDIVHIHTCSGLTFYRSILDLFLAKLIRSRVVFHIHGGRFNEFLNHSSVIGRCLLRRALRWADGVIALSSYWRNLLLEFDERIGVHVVHNGVPWPESSRSSSIDRVNLVFVGTLKKTKGIDDLIAVIAQLPKKVQAKIQVRVVGPDPDQRLDILRDRVTTQKLDGTIQFVGTLSEAGVDRELQSADVFVLPSYVEAMPIALIEAMARGIPSVVTNVGAIPEMIQHGIEGYLVAPGDQVKMRKYLRDLIEHPEWRMQIGKAARRRAREYFSQQAMNRSLAAVYRWLLSAGAGDPG